MEESEQNQRRDAESEQHLVGETQVRESDPSETEEEAMLHRDGLPQTCNTPK